MRILAGTLSVLLNCAQCIATNIGFPKLASTVFSGTHPAFLLERRSCLEFESFWD